VQGSVIIHAALLDIRAEPEKEFHDFVGFWALGGQSGEQGRETGVVPVIWVRSQFQECSHECDRTVIDRVFQNDLSDAPWTVTVREIRRISEQSF